MSPSGLLTSLPPRYKPLTSFHLAGRYILKLSDDFEPLLFVLGTMAVRASC